MLKALGCLLALAVGAFAQSEGPKIAISVEGFRYPPIARQASIQGDVVFAVAGTERRLVSGNRLLAPAAEKNLDSWTLPRLDRGSYQIRYHFVLLSKPICEDPSRSLPAQISSTRSGDDVMIDVLVQATRGCPQP